MTIDAIAKSVDVTGKVSLLVAPASEIAVRAGIFDDLSLVQTIATFGVVSLILERTINSIRTTRNDTKLFRIFTYTVWGSLWSSLAFITWIVL